MNKKIFRMSFFTSLFVLLVSFVLIFGVLFDYFEAQILNELKSEAGYISYAVQSEGVSYIENFAGSNKRITLISPDGTVLADTSADAAQLQNHSDREEIKEAMQNGTGTSSRYSDTLMQKTVYYAIKMNDGNILRVSTMQSSVVIIIPRLMQPLILVVLIVLIISFFLSRGVSKAIIKPINELDLENPANNETYEELSPLLKKLSHQKKTIDKHIKEANQKQEEFRLITENMSEGLLVIDREANIISFNQSAIMILETPEVNSDSALVFNRTKGFRIVIEKALSGERAEREIKLNENNYNLIANPIFEDENIIGAVIVIVDVTERARREQLRHEFTSNVSHELKTPLTSISGFAEMMKAGGTPEDAVVDFSNSIYSEAQRLISLVSDIIKISELDENQAAPTQEKVDLYALSEDVIKRLKAVAAKNGIEINLVGNSAWVFGTSKILDEIVYNLCDNAIKYNKENGRVDVIINETDSKVNLTVKDTGIGIPQSEQNRVFERFYRVDKSHSKLVGGTGLGLAIVKHAAAYHNAEISMESVEGKGTSITISFNK